MRASAGQPGQHRWTIEFRLEKKNRLLRGLTINNNMPVTEKNLEINFSKTVVMAATISSEEIQTINRIPESSNDDFFQLIQRFFKASK